ncbi:hypothetical protein MTO96_047582 [Rhipicephalus appendiculatus]
MLRSLRFAEVLESEITKLSKVESFPAREPASLSSTESVSEEQAVPFRPVEALPGNATELRYEHFSEPSPLWTLANVSNAVRAAPKMALQSAPSVVGEDADCLTASGSYIDDRYVPQSAYVSIFDAALPSTAGFTGIPFSSWLRLRFVDGPGSPSDAAYWLEFHGRAELKYRSPSASRDYISALLRLKQARLEKSSKHTVRRVDVRVTEDTTTGELHVGYSVNDDAEMYARNSDPPAVEHNLWEDPHGVRYGSVVTALRNSVPE